MLMVSEIQLGTDTTSDRKTSDPGIRPTAQQAQSPKTRSVQHQRDNLYGRPDILIYRYMTGTGQRYQQTTNKIFQ